MATTITGIAQTKVISNLDTYNHTALLNSMYSVSIVVTEQPPSGVVLTIQQNGSTKATTSVAPAAAQGVVSLQVVLNCLVNDVIGVIVSSAAASDTQLNTVKGILKISPGTT
jgi:hypothetical protein